jgi:predicted neutral ceramidase superfamily lipid hydrolase
MGAMNLDDILTGKSKQDRAKRSMLLAIISMILVITTALFLTSPTHDTDIIIVGIVSVLILLFVMLSSERKLSQNESQLPMNKEDVKRKEKEAAGWTFLAFSTLLIAVALYMAIPELKNPVTLVMGVVVAALIFYSIRFRGKRQSRI